MTVIHVDGSGYDGATCATCIVVDSSKPEVIIHYENMSSLEMEYLAIIEAAENHPNAKIYTDCLGAYTQITGRIMNCIDSKIISLNKRAKELILKNHIRLFWIPREENIAGHVLDKRKEKLKSYKYHSCNIRRPKWKKR